MTNEHDIVVNDGETIYGFILQLNRSNISSVFNVAYGPTKLGLILYHFLKTNFNIWLSKLGAPQILIDPTLPPMAYEYEYFRTAFLTDILSKCKLIKNQRTFTDNIVNIRRKFIHCNRDFPLYITRFKLTEEMINEEYNR